MRRMKGSVGRPSVRNTVKHPELAERIQTLMSRRGITRHDMSTALGCSEATFGNYYNGWREPPGKYADKIADVLGITIGYLLTGKKSEEPKFIEVTKSPLDPNELATLQHLLDKLQGQK
jgi:transcriptional regulator with XRE-family HTH domain